MLDYCDKIEWEMLETELEAFGDSVELETGSISGIVSDGEANPVAGATVTLTAEDGGDSTALLTTTTGADGRYWLDGIEEGKYDLVVTEPGMGYSDATATILKNENTMVDVTIAGIAAPVVGWGGRGI